MNKITALKTVGAAALAGAAVALSGCSSEADTSSENVGRDAEQFKVGRRIVVIDSIRDKVVWSVEGRCSFEVPSDRRLDVICKNSPSSYTKATIGLGDNTTWASVQLGPINVNAYRTKVVLRPQTLVPDFDLVTGQQR